MLRERGRRQKSAKELIHPRQAEKKEEIDSLSEDSKQPYSEIER